MSDEAPEELFETGPMTRINSGTVTVYDRKTGVASKVLEYLLPGQLRKKHADGTPAFTINPPAEPPHQGTIKCLLHADDPNRRTYDEWGFAVCPKHNLPSRFALEQHMTHKHRVEYQAIKREEERTREEEQRAFQRSIAEIARGSGRLHFEICEACGEKFESEVPVAAKQKMRAHQRAAHQMEV